MFCNDHCFLTSYGFISHIDRKYLIKDSQQLYPRRLYRKKSELVIFFLLRMARVEFLIIVLFTICGLISIAFSQTTYEPTTMDWRSEYATAAGADGYSSATESPEAVDEGRLQAINEQSENLTKANNECDMLISDNLFMANLESETLKATQPKIPIDINIQLILISLNEVTETSGTISLTARLDFQWTDQRLKIANLTRCKEHDLLVETTKIWFPYFIVQNGAQSVFYPDAWEAFPSNLRTNGHIDWRVAFQFNLKCEMDLTIFPFDTQICKVLIQSPHFGNSELIYNVSDSERAVLYFKKDDLSTPMWEIQKQKVKFTSKVPGVLFFMTLRREFYFVKIFYCYFLTSYLEIGKYNYYIWTILIPVCKFLSF